MVLHYINLITCIFLRGIAFYYMASSVSGQDESNPANPAIGYPSWQDGAILPAQDYPGLVPHEIFSQFSTPSRSINMQKKNLANIQPS